MLYIIHRLLHVLCGKRQHRLWVGGVWEPHPSQLGRKLPDAFLVPHAGTRHWDSTGVPRWVVLLLSAVHYLWRSRGQVEGRHCSHWADPWLILCKLLIDQSINQSVNQLIDQAIHQLFIQSINQCSRPTIFITDGLNLWESSTRLQESKAKKHGPITST